MRFIQSAVRCAVVFAVLALALAVGAEPVSKPLKLITPAKVGRTQLAVGDYKILIDGEKVTVKQGKKIIAETTGEFVQRAVRETNNSVVVGSNGELQEVRFEGEKRVLILHN